ncbi:MAG: 1-(5-phosphoribosyl)-5-[(5-phosphoribosylamino)methylideneamino]imidazole-4-carboxamide isomerase [Candidatus Marinimicrobia bacterium]|nr:1-(5-phosphoribosyl)-5-[(5-phosphoribosylamino)methylideneamino]imidazole-4-carboxamide isomerase [Candidatus Neomarinimicrobiota bacterium]
MIIPSIDLIGGQTVRLFKGDYEKINYYEQSPLALVRSYSKAGADLIHLVDLQGAKEITRRQLPLIQKLVSSTDVHIQVGGGIRSEEDVRELLEVGVERVVIGSLAIKEPEKVMEWVKRYGSEKIVLALDVNIDEKGVKWLPTQAWQQDGQLPLEALLDQYLSVQIKHILCTDISRDGTLSGSNDQLYSELQQNYPHFTWQASGGIGSLGDIAKIAATGVSGIIVGKALLDGIFTFREAQSCWLGE